MAKLRMKLNFIFCSFESKVKTILKISFFRKLFTSDTCILQNVQFSLTKPVGDTSHLLLDIFGISRKCVSL